MAIEIERKFLIKNDNWKPLVQKGQAIKQGYLNLDPERTVRVRLINQKGFLTIKGKSINTSRLEFEYEIPHEEAEELLKLSDKTGIEKTRYELPADGVIWEIDIFQGQNEGLRIAEIELTDENQPFEKPEWLGHEVSLDSRYYNSNLILHPFKKW